MASSITLYDDAGNPVVIDGEDLKSIIGSGGKNLCTAWVLFDGTTTPPTIVDSYNVSSVSKLATGHYGINFEIPMDNANYTVVATSYQRFSTTSEPTSASTAEVSTYTSAASKSDDRKISVQVFGGKD